MSVIGAMDGQGTLQSPGYSEPAEKKPKKVEKDKGSTSKSKPSTDKPVKTADKPARSSTDSKVAELDQKCSVRFNRLEDLLMARTLDREPTFQTVKVALTYSPPAGVVISTDPFIKTTDYRPTCHPIYTDLYRPTLVYTARYQLLIQRDYERDLVLHGVDTHPAYIHFCYYF